MVYFAGKLIEKLVKSLALNRHLQAFLVFSQHPTLVLSRRKTHRKCGLLLKKNEEYYIWSVLVKLSGL